MADSLTALKAQHPMPWGYVTLPTGLIIAQDANGNEVPLLTLLNFVGFITGKL
jgi:hypothetical protein